MCGSVVIFPRWFMVAVAVGAVVFCPVVLVGALVVGAGKGIKKLTGGHRSRRSRALQKYWYTLNRGRNKDSPLQTLWDARQQRKSDAFAGFRLAFAFFSLGDIHAALVQFNDVLQREENSRGRHLAAALHHVGMCECQLQRWEAAVTHLTTAEQLLVGPVQGTAGAPPEVAWQQFKEGATEANVTMADIRGLLAYARLMQATRGAAAVVMDEAGVRQALTLAELAAAEAPATARHHYIAAWALYFLALRPDVTGQTVTVDEALLRRALTLLQQCKDAAATAERETNEAIIAEFGERATNAVAAVILNTGVVDGAVVPKALDTLAIGDSDTDDGDLDTDSTDSTPLEATATGEGAGGVSIADVLSLQAQVYLALDQHAEAETALAAARAIDASVSHSGLSVAEGEADPRVGLLAPWPLPVGPSGESIEGMADHDFAPTTLVKPTWCDHCMKRIKGFHHGLRCKACSYTIHAPEEGDSGNCHRAAMAHRCLSAPAPPSAKTPAADETVSHQHQLRQRRIHTTHDCIHCGKFIMMMTRALECHVCRGFVHVDCGGKLANSILDTASIPAPRSRLY